MSEKGDHNEENISEADNVLLAATEESPEEQKTAADQTDEPDETKTETEEKQEGEEEEPSPPEYTLETASEDIEHYLSNLPSTPPEVKTEKAEETTEKTIEKAEETTEETIEKAEETAEETIEKAEETTEETTEKAEETTEETIEKAEETKKVEGATGLVIPEFIEKYLDLFEEKLSILESSAADTKVKGYQLPDDNPVFFKAIGHVSNLYKKLSAFIILKSKDGPLINQIGEIHHRAMCYLADELKFLLLESRNMEQPDTKEEVAVAVAVADETTGTELNEDQPAEEKETELAEYSDQVLSNINKMVMEMISGGHEMECCEVYMLCRSHVIGETLKNLGIEKVSIEEAYKMQWELLEREIPPWIATFKQCANVHFITERKLVDTVFAGHPSLSDPLIINLVRCLFIQFLYFPEAVSFCKLTTEKLFKFLDIYEALRDNLSPIDSIFPEECAKELRTEMTTCRCRIGEAAICIFCDLENSIMSDTGKTPVAGGAVHPLTRYIMNYLKYACEYKNTIEQVFKDHSKIERADSTSRPRNYVSKSEKYKKNDDGTDRSPYQEQLMRFMDLLDSAIEAKSKLYKDVSLSCIFMMNNGRYMLQKIKGTAELHQVVGEKWCRNRSFDVRNYHKSYQRETWTKLLGCISNDGLTVRGKVVKPVLKEKFKSFNAMFDEIHRTQSLWVVYDEQLQSELRISIASVVIPAYRSFLGRYSGYLDPGRQTEKYIKFQPEDIENYINDDLFDGNPGRKH